MTVGIKVGSIVSEVGSANFLNAFFSTIRGLIDRDGTKYPVVCHDLYRGRVLATLAYDAHIELVSIQKQFERLSATELIWDIEDLIATPPFENAVRLDRPSLVDYFVTTTGRNLFSVLIDCSRLAERHGYDIAIVEVPKLASQITWKIVQP